MPAFGPIPGPHARDDQGSFPDGSLCGGHGFCLDKTTETERTSDGLEERPCCAGIFCAKPMFDSIGTHLHGRDRLVYPGGHDICHAGRTAAGRSYGLFGTAGDGVRLFAPPLVVLLVIHRLLIAGSDRIGSRNRRFHDLLIATAPECQPVVRVDAAGLLQSRRGLEGDHIGPGVGTILAVDRCSDECLHSLDIDASGVIPILNRRQGLCQGCQRLQTGDSVYSLSMLALEGLCGSLLLDGKGVLHGESHQQAVSAGRLL